MDFISYPTIAGSGMKLAALVDRQPKNWATWMEGDNTMMEYSFPKLSREERESLEAILLEEIDIQTWFAVAYSRVFHGEIFITLQ